MATVVKPFRWSPDGFATEQLQPGDEREFGRATAGLIAEGYVTAEAPDETVIAPDQQDEKRRPGRPRKAV